MKEKIIEDNLKRKELQELLEKVKMKSTSFSIARYYEGYMSEDDFNHMQLELKDKMVYEHEQHILDYKENRNGYRDELDSLFHFNDEKEAMDYFDELFNHQLEVYEEYQFCEFENQKKDILDVPQESLLKKEYTRITPVSIGPVFEVYTFSMDVFDDVTNHMKKLFSTYKIYGSEFEDLCCYDEKGNVILKICSHESYAIIDEDIN